MFPFQVGCSERLRMQVSALKSLLDSDNAKVRLAMRELDRLKQLLRDKELEKAVLERVCFRVLFIMISAIGRPLLNIACPSIMTGKLNTYSM